MIDCKHERAESRRYEFQTCTLHIKNCPDCHEIFEDEIIDKEVFIKELDHLLSELDKTKANK
jgi:transcription initiation factor IIE alpha subunit